MVFLVWFNLPHRREYSKWVYNSLTHLLIGGHAERTQRLDILKRGDQFHPVHLEVC